MHFFGALDLTPKSIILQNDTRAGLLFLLTHSLEKSHSDFMVCLFCAFYPVFNFHFCLILIFILISNIFDEFILRIFFV